jgi:bla regulator protein BlaR1
MNAFALVLNSLWQSAAVAALVWLALRFLPGVNAATRYILWWVALVIVLLLPLAPVLTRPETVPASVNSAHAAPPNTLLPAIEVPVMVTLHPRPSAKWPLAITLLWSLAFLYGLNRIARSYLWLRQVKARATASSEPLPITRRNATLLLSADVSSPMAVGFLKPAVILPESLASDLDSTEFDNVVLHETAHLARFDDWANLAARVLGAALALHPVAWWILRQIERDREIACDDWVVARTGKARMYAASLARMYELRWLGRDPWHEDVLASGIFGQGFKTAQRVELLMRRGRDFSAQVSIVRVALSTAALLALAATSSHAPRWIAFAQQDLRPSFEVASVKPGDPGSRRFGIGSRGTQFQVTNAPLKMMIGFAYDIQNHQILGGPKWIISDRFNIEARPGPGAPMATGPEGLRAQRLMLQSLLEERFKLRLHREIRIEQVYELVVAKGGPRLTPSAGPGADGREGIFGRGFGGLTATNRPIESLAGLLSQRLGRSVIDKTGLSGKYDFELSFMPEVSPGDLELFGPPPPEAIPPADANLPSIFTALPDQIGLKLESARGPVEVVVIDSAEKPDAN